MQHVTNTQFPLAAPQHQRKSLPVVCRWEAFNVKQQQEMFHLDQL